MGTKTRVDPFVLEKAVTCCRIVTVLLKGSEMTSIRLLNVLMIGVAMALISACSASATYKTSTKSEPVAKSGCCSGTAEAGEADGARASNQEAKTAFANTKCPIMGGAIDLANVTPELTREYKGQKVAFCCGGCPGQWDKLSDQEKTAKLRDAR
jgi:hypothetical protein